jgi:DNA-binding NtrC family response regulator
MIRTMRSHRAFMAASFAGLATVVAVASWQDRSATLRAAEDHVELLSGSLDLVRKARELMPDLKIVAVSGNVTEETIRASRIDRCSFLPKPFRPSDLNRAVGELL